MEAVSNETEKRAKAHNEWDDTRAALDARIEDLETQVQDLEAIQADLKSQVATHTATEASN